MPIHYRLRADASVDLSVFHSHIPRTGGSALNQLLRGVFPYSVLESRDPTFMRRSLQHLTLRQIDELIDREKITFQFTVVRHPLSRLISEWRYRTSEQVPVEQWIEFELRRFRADPFILDGHLIPQCEYIDNNVTVFRFEDGLTDVTEQLSKIVKIPLQISKRPPQVLEPDTLRHGLMTEIREIYRSDFEYLGY